MPGGIAVMEWYTPRSGDEAMADALEQAEVAGFDVENREENPHAGGDGRYLNIDYRQWQFSFVFNLQEDRNPGEPLLRIDCGNTIYPSETDDGAAYRDLINTLFELLCRVATALNAEYAALFNPESRNAIPHSRPFVDGITELPRMGVYSEQVIDQFGGLDAMFGPDRWYTATLDERRTVVIDAKSGWLSGPWQPPMDVPYLDDITVHDDSADAGEEDLVLSDPFAALAVGDYGVDACIAREDIAATFHNEDHQAVRVYVDEEWNLRRVSDDSFVRNVVTDAPDDETAIIEGMLAEIPPDADGDLMVSALLHGAIPPSFVRLDDPDGDNVVSRVLDLDVETNKVDLLVSLGTAAQHGDGLATQTIESALDNLADLEDVEGIERYIQQNLL